MPNNKDYENKLRQLRAWIQELENDINKQCSKTRERIDDELLRMNKESEATPIKIKMPGEEEEIETIELKGHRQGGGKERE